mmetsp:Transcript_38220/g.61218  ORF Transcript_38220/g.61218 Transcript_38220/m.61218 type:complete len:95 (-) Transcript_38220:4422-4706(-)
MKTSRCVRVSKLPAVHNPLNFFRRIKQVLFQKIRSGEYSMDDNMWDHISSGAKDCVSKLLKVDTAERMTCSEALRHPWVSVGRAFCFYYRRVNV